MPIAWWKSDNQGYFVAKFNMEDVEELFQEVTLPLEIKLTLSGQTVYDNDSDEEGDYFTGSQDILVIDFEPRPQGGRT